MSEGAGMVVLATATAVERLGLKPQAELLGYAAQLGRLAHDDAEAERITRCVARR